ncbi:Hypothetical protein A7982_08068 [Minicystis rosea]|nr:Hypothetical protein A7982_08068 [Minicystis rosea]
MANGALGLRMAYAWMMLFFFGGTTAIPLLVLPETRLYTLAVIAIIVGAVLAYRRYRKQPAIFVTDARLVDRGLLGTKSVELPAIATYARQVVHYHYKGSVSQVATNLLVIGERGRTSTIGPVLEYDEISNFLSGVIAREIHPPSMRSLDGQPAAAEQREDIFVAVDNRSDGEVYGPLFIGPRGLVRFTSKLPVGLEGLLLTTLAGPGPLEDLENRAAALARRPDAGHVLLVDISKVELHMDGASLQVVTTARPLTDPGRTMTIQLGDADAARARKYLKARRGG